MADHDAHAPERALTEENAELWKDVDKGSELHSLKAEYLVLMPRFNCMYAVAKMKIPNPTPQSWGPHLRRRYVTVYTVTSAMYMIE